MRIADLMGVGAGGGQIPYDQSGGGDQDVLAGAQAAGQAATPAPDVPMGVAPPSLGGAMGDPGAQDMAQPDLGAAGGMGAVDPMAAGGDMAGGAEMGGMDPGAGGDMTTDSLSDNDLAAMDNSQGPDLEQIMNDPSLSPEDRAAIEQQVLMAARRQIAGM
jgi:hypothetical protein